MRLSNSCRRRFAVVALLASTLLCAGCSGKKDPWNRAAVQGEVRLDGEPLKVGVITFFPVDGTKGPAAGADIVDGAYSISADQGPVIGTNRIEIRSVQSTGRMVPSPEAPMAAAQTEAGMLVEEFVDVVPVRYNSQSELKQSLEADKVNHLDFPLTTTSPK